jgi:Protein of unknown function (DUF2844)
MRLLPDRTMSRTWSVTACALAATCILLARPLPAAAALGGDETSIETDRVHMQAALLQVTPADAYTVHAIQTASGITVREYASPTGSVFAVAWQGRWQPDLRQVLGPYFAQYLQAAAGIKRARRGPLVIQQADFVLELGGQPRAFVGRAYVPRLMPQGVTTERIR